eukprot:3994948-Pyramimonas_sp.AAC.1
MQVLLFFIENWAGAGATRNAAEPHGRARLAVDPRLPLQVRAVVVVLVAAVHWATPNTMVQRFFREAAPAARGCHLIPSSS